jgi:hypothetical protein
MPSAARAQSTTGALPCPRGAMRSISATIPTGATLPMDLGIFLIEYCFYKVTKHGQLLGFVNVNDVTDEDILGMIILDQTNIAA